MKNDNPKGHSFSRINTFTDICERQAAYGSFIEGNWDTPAIKRGTHVHDALEAATNRMIRGKTAKEALEYTAEHPPKGYLKENILAGYLERAAPIFDKLKPTIAEEWFDTAGGLPIRGKVDLQSETTPIFDSRGLLLPNVLEESCVLDHKTIGNSTKIKSAYEAKQSLQLRIYAIATGHLNAGFLYYLPSGAVRGVVVKFTKAELDLTKKWLTEEIKVINSRWVGAKNEDGTYDVSKFSLARPGMPLCCKKWCNHWDLCLGKKEEGDAKE